MINGGSDSGIKEGNELRIIGSKTIPIKDPCTNDVIEEIPTYKANLTAKIVYKKVTICKTAWIDDEVQPSVFNMMIKYNYLENTLHEHTIEGHYEEIPINEEQASSFDDHDDTPVSLNDEVELISENTNQN